MAILGDPFVGNVPKQMTAEELSQAVRVNIADEMEAIISYQSHMLATSDQRVIKVFSQIADEERQHVGELQQLLFMLSARDAEKIEKGRQMVVQQQQTNFQVPIQ